mgnify:CR=1 FL=1
MKTNQSLTTTNFIGYAQEEYENLKPLIEITKAFVRSSNQYIYIIDFLKKDFLYVSDKIVRLCGEEIDGKKRFNLLDTVQAVYEKYGVPVYSIVNMEDIIQGIRDEVIPGKEHLDAMLAYREQYGVKA